MLKKFEFKEIDNRGIETLNAIDNADNFNEWMYQTIKPYCQGKVLEIGSGIGNISRYFLRDGFDISLSDIRQNYCDLLQEKFASAQVVKFDLVQPDFNEKMNSHLGQYDTIFALNVVEHIEDDDLAIANAVKLLKPGGKLIILVPAYQSLYNQFDTELEHYRRYTKRTLNKVISKHLQLIHSQYFNAAGIAGWLFSGSILKKKTIPSGHMSLYNKLVPAFRLLDKLVVNSLGLSVIAVGVKKQ